jgi:hypothetical protein
VIQLMLRKWKKSQLSPLMFTAAPASWFHWTQIRAGVLNLPAWPYRILGHQMGTVGPFPREAYHSPPLACRRLEWPDQHLNATIHIHRVQIRTPETDLHRYVIFHRYSVKTKLCNSLQYFRH